MKIITFPQCIVGFQQRAANCINLYGSPHQGYSFKYLNSFYFNIVFKFAIKFSLVYISFINICVSFSLVFILWTHVFFSFYIV